MVYRIRYRLTDTDDQAETVVEANNTAEAVVKFFHTQSNLRDSLHHHQLITSISQETPIEVADSAADSALPY